MPLTHNTSNKVKTKLNDYLRFLFLVNTPTRTIPLPTSLFILFKSRKLPTTHKQITMMVPLFLLLSSMPTRTKPCAFLWHTPPQRLIHSFSSWDTCEPKRNPLSLFLAFIYTLYNHAKTRAIMTLTQVSFLFSPWHARNVLPLRKLVFFPLVAQNFAAIFINSSWLLFNTWPF